MKIQDELALFSLGGSGYCLTELLWRRRTDWSMFFLGGTCFLLIGKLNRTRLPFVCRVFSGSALITALELTAGLLIIRDYHIWDYRKMPFQYRGQICLPYSLLWLLLSAGALWLDSAVDPAVKKDPAP